MEYNILKFGAGTEKLPRENSTAIQAAVDAAFEAGGGTVYVPPGTYQTANIQLRSNVFLYLERGAELLGSDRYEDYRLTDVMWPWEEMAGLPANSERSCTTGLIYAVNAHHMGIGGGGILDGGCGTPARFPDNGDPYRRRPMLVFFDRCTDICMEGITLRRSAMFASWMSRSRRICIRGIKVFSMQTENGDGLDFNGSSDVQIADCLIESGDDAISLKTTYPEWPCSNYTISNCILRSVWAGFRMGPESTGDMCEITLSNCVFAQCNDGLKIQDCSVGRFENVRISNVVMRDVHRPVFMTVNSFRLSRNDPSIRPKPGGIRDVHMDGMTAYMHPYSGEYQRNCFVVSGCETSRIQDVSFSRCKVVFRGDASPDAFGRVDTPEFLDYSFMYGDVFSINGDYPASGVFLRHVDGLTLTDCSFRREDGDKRPLLFGYDLQNAFVRSVKAISADGTDFFQAADAEVSLTGCIHNGRLVPDPAALDPQQRRRYENFVRVSRETDRYFDQLAAAVDRAQSYPCRKRLESLVWSRAEDVWATELELPASGAMLVLSTYGNVHLYANGRTVGSCLVPKCYRNRMVWAADLSGLPAQQVRLELHWEDPTDRGGADCLLPFGAFRPMGVGFCAPITLHFAADGQEETT